ncbi:unnamed protein product [Clavelina lepadiformis]|uniref:G-protein coupled receptors family 1 profile domain-containing protein n=1 Tax=Clavelina lepadiformis TaxID=159417 RepID=A0ABP0GSX7_CLALP
MTSPSLNTSTITARTDDDLSFLPGVCIGTRAKVYKSCANLTLFDCKECGVARGAAFLSTVLCLALAILVGNCLTLFLGIRRCRRGKESKVDICRNSLAMMDVTIGVHLLVAVYNFSWSMNSTPFELDRVQWDLRGSPQAIAGGMCILLAITSSTYHLALMAMERFYAIAPPFKYKWQSTKSVYLGIGMVWILTSISSSLVAVSKEITFTYSAPVFLFLPIPLKMMRGSNSNMAIGTFIIFYLFPYLLTNVLILATGILLRQRQNLAINKCRKFVATATNKNKLLRKARPLITIAIMQTLFTITLLPLLVIVYLLYSGSLEWTTISTVLLICYYFALSNRLVLNTTPF